MRELNKNDFESLGELVLSVYRDSPQAMLFGKEPTAEELRILFLEKLEQMGKKGVVDIVAEIDGKIVGECEIAIRNREGTIGLIINREWRRKHVGRQLLSKGMIMARTLGVELFKAEVEKGNAPALLFFSDIGFDENKKYENRVLMRKLA